ncbi:head-tail connector protein [Caballeronia zhejiangensis]|uniref:head-tail connector protein n=1 Tax=Caballeronia zhejiangensis TaxID=871203 RepID=UPI00158CCE7F|nr:head-tail connector protein [Caballeronia zhejiangensis]MCG7403016.1 head-tail connector protein [Caballeronia zhejiangensis]MCI1043840.1 phage gp6-like head-tail connector protein [Caballeronia zhejiangensis]
MNGDLVTIDEARAALRLDEDFPDLTIQIAVTSASDSVVQYLKLKAPYTDENPPPPNVKQATLLLTGIFLRDPDGVEAQTWEQGYLPWAVCNLLHQRRDPAME